MDKSSGLFYFANRLILITLILVFVTACNVAQGEEQQESGRDLTSQESALSSEDDVDEGGSDEPGVIQLTCPDEVVDFKLQLNHTFDFSPNRDTEKMLVSGHTSPDVWCLVTLKGKTIEADDCIVDYEYSGFIQGSDGKCDIQGASTALISIEGECMEGVDGSEIAGVAEVYLQITETQDPDADVSGAMNCPGFSSAYIGFYPPSFSVMNFVMEQGGASDSDNMDMTGQYEMNKTWTLIPVGFLSGQ